MEEIEELLREKDVPKGCTGMGYSQIFGVLIEGKYEALCLYILACICEMDDSSFH